jgi:hypothetical protein
MSWLSILQWMQDTQSSTAIRESQYVFPILEGIHLLGLAFMMGSVMMLDLRLVGVLWKNDTASKVKQQFLPITVVGFIVMIVTGLLLFWSEPLRCWDSQYFRIKLIALALAGGNALLFHSTVDRHIADWDTSSTPPARARWAGIVSLVLWTGVIFAGRYTAYHL